MHVRAWRGNDELPFDQAKARQSTPVPPSSLPLQDAMLHVVVERRGVDCHVSTGIIKFYGAPRRCWSPDDAVAAANKIRVARVLPIGVMARPLQPLRVSPCVCS